MGSGDRAGVVGKVDRGVALRDDAARLGMKTGYHEGHEVTRRKSWRRGCFVKVSWAAENAGFFAEFAENSVEKINIAAWRQENPTAHSDFF